MNNINIIGSTKALVYISLVCTLISILLLKTKFIGSIKYICGISILVSVLYVISPLINSLENLVNIDFSVDSETDTPSNADELIINQSGAYICEYVKTLLNQKYSIPPENISASVTFDSSEKENIILKNITLSFRNTDEGLYPQIAEYISDTLGCHCTVISK